MSVSIGLDSTSPSYLRPLNFVAHFLWVMTLVLLVACGAPDGDSPPPVEESGGITTARLGGVARALNILKSTETTCPAYVQEDLVEPTLILPGTDGVLETQLVVGMRDRCVPVYDGTNNVWTKQVLSLRTYGFPTDPAVPITAEMVQTNPDDPAITWTAPGPTFRLEKATAAGENDGTNFKMTLFNILEPQDDPHGCDTLNDGSTPTTSPNCFHGNNSTNFHFHGFHVSPQPHQDFIGLELLPFGAAALAHSIHGERGVVEIGEYSFDVDRLRYTQAEGTHWYHAHKHGSTALQVLNGLVGTFKIHGAFDTELEALFSDQPDGLTDRLLVVQQLEERLPGVENPSPKATKELINGQGNPIVKMKPGEIQRWRFVGATMQASAQLEIGFTGAEPPEIRQIAMDGVQFAPYNYECQTIFNGPDCTPDDPGALNFNLDPGNRIDILIKAPTTPGRYTMEYKTTAVIAEILLTDLEERGQVTNPPLLTLEVTNDAPLYTSFPTVDEFPKMPTNPAYLADIPTPAIDRTVGYEMANQGQISAVDFSINGTKYNPDCVNETITLEKAEAWTLTNNSGIAHPFHIHTNPFQLISTSTVGSYNPPYVWKDVIAIPTGTPTDLGNAVIYYKAEEFTGEFVNHCHILGHEDRGMMHGVQTVCANGMYGMPTSNLSSECVDGNYIEAAPACVE